MGRTSSVAAQVEVLLSSVRPNRWRCSTRATMITMSSATSTMALRWNAYPTTWPTTAMHSDAVMVIGMLSIPAMTAAANATRRTSVPTADEAADWLYPKTGTWSTAAMAASTPASAHTTVDNDFTLTPSSLALSPFCAAPRMAIPRLV